MTKRRMIHDCLWKSEGLAELTIRQRLLWVGLITTSDDQGRGRAHPGLIRSTIFPFDAITNNEIKADLEAITNQDMVIVYLVKNKSYYQVINWWEYQKPQWAYPSDYPAPDGWQDRLRYRQEGNVLTDNWKPDDDKKEEIPLPKALPKALPDTDTLSDGQAHSNSNSISPSSSNNKDIYVQLKDYWHDYFPDKPQPRKLGGKNAKHLNARIGDDEFLANWRAALLRASKSKWLNDNGFFTLWWFIANDDNWQKCLDGNYDDKRTDAPKLAKPIDCDDATEFFKGAG